MLRTATVCVIVGAATFSLFKWRPIRPISMDSVPSTLYWTTRSWLWGNPGRDLAFWALDPFTGRGKPPKDRARWLKFWDFASPLLASKGYFLYSVVQPTNRWVPMLQRSRKAVPPSQQFVETHERDDEDAQFRFGAARIWPAQDKHGRDVIIKFLPRVRCGGELDTLSWLNTPEVLLEGHNFTVPILEYIQFGDATFVVMQRWGIASDPDFATVEDFVLHGRGALETLAFFHRHDVTHADIWWANLLIDVVIPDIVGSHMAGVRGPQRRYALIDFETARVGVPGEEGEQRRKQDVAALGRLLEPQLRCLCVEGFVPELTALLDQLLLEESAEQPTAATALARYIEICASLSEADLKTTTSAFLWYDGGVQYRDRPPIYSLPPRDKQG